MDICTHISGWTYVFISPRNEVSELYGNSLLNLLRGYKAVFHNSS